MDVVSIQTEEGKIYKFDPETERVFLDGVLLSKNQAEPVYSDVNGSTVFSGLFLKLANQILTLSGKINPVTNSASL